MYLKGGVTLDVDYLSLFFGVESRKHVHLLKKNCEGLVLSSKANLPLLYFVIYFIYYH